jgi:aspartyl aminopeptidase
LSRENWELAKGGKYFFTRNNTTIMAFTVGGKFDPNNTGFKIIGTHTDSPILKLAPISKLQAHTFNTCAVNCYGGGLWHTWFDRDLTVGGRVIYKDATGKVLNSKLYHCPRPLMRIANLAIHLRPTDERSKLDPNKEEHLRPILSSEVYRTLTHGPGEPDKDATGIAAKHYAGLLQLVSKDTGIDLANITDIDFCLTDAQPACFIGLDEDFVTGPRFDNLMSSYFALRSILNADEIGQADSSFVNLICLFDHEEVGSLSAQGADSVMLVQNLRRIYNLLVGSASKPDSFETAIQKSFVISCDVAHSIHPNYAGKHQELMRPIINKGMVMKINVNQNYATDTVSSSILRLIADNAKVPIQEYAVRNDSPCGTTIGPITAGKTGIKTVDVGAPILSMHSIRELAGVVDTYYNERLFTVTAIASLY